MKERSKMYRANMKEKGLHLGKGEQKRSTKLQLRFSLIFA